MSRGLLAWSCALVLALASTLALAQDADRQPPTTVLLDLGFNGHMPAGRWAPVRVVVSPMDEAIEAVARLRVESAGGQIIQTLVPVATTPAKQTVVPATIWIPPSIASITVELVGQGGRRVAASAYGAVPGVQALAINPPPTTMPIILGVGTPSLRLAFGDTNYERTFDGPQAALVGDRAAVAKVATAVPSAIGEPIWLPATPMAYEGLAAIVIDGQLASRIEPEGLRAMRRWLVSGGRLMIVNADNNALNLILAEHLPAGLTSGSPTSADLPPVLGGPGQVIARELDARSLPRDWKPLAVAPSLAAHGPVGLGWAMVLSFDPDGLADADLLAATETAWHASLGDMIHDELEAGRASLGNQNWDAQPLDTVAATRALAWVSRAPVVGVGAFLAIFAMMAGLAVALGPVDRFVLRRLRSLHRWWLAALAWIALASIGAWILPSRVRSGPTTVTSVRVVDAWRAPDGRAHAWQASVDGIFMNRSATIGLDDLDEGSWLSPMTHPWFSSRGASLVMAPEGSVMRPRPTSARLWTVTTFRQQGPTTPPIAARFESRGNAFTLRLTGEATDRIDIAAVRTGGQWLDLTPHARHQADGAVFEASRRDLTPRPPRALELSADDGGYSYYGYYDPYSTSPSAPEPALLLHLDGPSARTRAIDALSDSDRWAVVYLRFTNDQPLLGSDVGQTFSTTWVCRLAVPVEAAGPTPPAGGTP